MFSTRLRVLSLVLTLTFFSNYSLAKKHPKETKPTQPALTLVSHPGAIADDSAIVAAVQSQRGVRFVEGGNLTVTAILPDDTQGRPHQKWEAELSDGSVIMVVYNSDMGDQVPVQLGAKFSVGGEFIWTKDGGLVHWVHEDPKQKRPDGFVYINETVYGIVPSEQKKKKNR